MASKVGGNQSSQNEIELQVTLELCQKYIEAGIEAKKITIISRHQGQLKLSKRAIALDTNINLVDTATIDTFQGEEDSVIIMCIVVDQTLGFMSDPRRLLTGCSRARDGLVIICNYKGLKGEYPRKRSVLEYIHKEFQAAGAHAEFSQTFEP